MKMFTVLSGGRSFPNTYQCLAGNFGRVLNFDPLCIWVCYRCSRTNEADVIDVGGSPTAAQAQCEAEEKQELPVVVVWGILPLVSSIFVLVYLAPVFFPGRCAFLAFFRKPASGEKQQTA